MHTFYVGDEEERLSYLAGNIINIIEHVCGYLQMPDANASQGICVFLELHPVSGGCNCVACYALRAKASMPFVSQRAVRCSHRVSRNAK